MAKARAEPEVISEPTLLDCIDTDRSPTPKHPSVIARLAGFR